MPLPVPKPRLQETPLPQDSKSQAADKEIVSSTTTLQSPDSGDSGEAASTEHEGRLFDGCNDSEGDSPSSEIQLVCTPSSPHSSSDPKAGEKPHRIEPYPEAPLNSQPGVFLHFEGDRKEEPDIPEGMYMELGTSPSEVDVHCTTVVLCSSNLGSPVFPDGGVREAEHPPFSKVHNPLPPAPAKPLPPLRMQSTNTDREMRKIYETLTQKVVEELKEKFPSNSEETKSKKETHLKKEKGHNIFLFCKRSPTHATAPSSSQKMKSPLAELILLTFKSKENIQEPQEATVNTQSTSALESPERESEGDTTVKDCRDASDATSPATPLGIQACLDQEEDMLPHLAKDVQDTMSSLQCVMSKTSIRECHMFLKPFWKDRTIVLNSGVLTQLNKQQLLLQESMYEVVTTEQSYLKSLNVVVDLFMESPTLNKVLAPRDRKSLFSSIGRIREISQNFLDAMKVELGSNLYCNVCEVIRLHASGNFAAYVNYIRNIRYQEQTLHNLGKENPQIEEILRQLQEDSRCNRLPLKSFLVLPFQRITRLKILVQTILKRTDPGSDEQLSAERALKEVSKVVEACNHEVGRMQQMEELVHIANKTEYNCKGLPLVSSSRWLVRQGELAQLTDKGNIFGQRKGSPVHLFLFNDLLLVTIKKGLDRFVVQDHVHRSLIEIADEAEEVECELENTFLLVLLKNHKGTTSRCLLRAPSSEEKASWVEALKPRNSEKNEMYEEWDCPQVQCIADYSAQQPGELSLLIGDVLNVIQKTNDGFLEGRRPVDGERGWFPSSTVVEISSEYVRRRHLRQRYHVLQAANRVLRRRIMSRGSVPTTC
ncbi:ephexin-1 [Conger conger]|uniref:ephexin-1 n=1 Tax=Conger conger TaxID=82655 RepID=UPI002A5A3FEA|nr:ephexin-1 [Conger conger]